jgi:hypothetical protein
MKKIIAMVRPFDAQQILMVYEDGNKIDMIQTSIADFNESLFALSEKHEVYQLDMTGPKKYIKGLEKQIKEAEMTKYSANKIEVNII